MSTKKTITPLNLRDNEYFFEFTTSQNPYLGITGLDDVVSSGRYSFLINGSEYLKQDSIVRFEAVDSDGNLLFISGVRNLLRGTARVVTFEINNNISNGIAKIYVAAELDTFDDNGSDSTVPSEYQGKENILLTHTFQIDKTRVNSDEIIFRRPPELNITPTLRKVRTIVKPTITSSTITADIDEYFYDSARSRFELKVTSRDNDIVLDMDNSPITVTNTPIDIEGGRINITGRVKEALLTIPNPDLEKYSKQDFQNLLQSPITFTVTYNDFTQYNLVKLQEAAFADVVINNMETVSGDVEKIKIFGKSDTLNTDYDLLSEYDLIAKNLLDIEGIGDIGIFDTSDKLNNWTVTKVDTTVSDPTIGIDNTRLLSAITVQGDYNLPKTKEIGGKLLQKPRYKLESNTSLTFYKNVEYKIKLNAALINTPSQADTRCDVYIQGTGLDGDTNQFGKLLGSLRSNKNYVWDNEFETTFTNTSNVSDGKIVFVITSGQWILQKIQIGSELEQGFSPQEFRVQVPVEIRKNQQDIDFIVEFFDANNNKAETILRKDNVIFDRPNLVIEGFDNFLSGSLFVGEATSSGIGLGLSDAGGAFIKSVPYDGFIDATTGGQSGFLLYSGSVTSSVQDEYTGSLGVEIVKDEDNYLRFRTEPSLFEVKSDVFFFGNADTQFISGSNSNIEISASNFHLDPKNDILIIKGAIRQDSNGVELTDFRNRGTWASGVIYLNNDLVQYDVSGKTQTYIAVNDHTSSVSDPNGPPEPDTSNNWEIFAASGDDGSDGADGADGDPGPGVVFRGEWNSGTTYFASTTRRDVVVYDDGGGDDYYLATSTHTASSTNAPDGVSSAWEGFGATFSSVATDILFAQDVYANRTINIGSDGGNPVIALDSDFSNSNANPTIKISSTGYNTNGIFLGYDSGTPKLSLKSATNSLLWNGTSLNITGNINAEGTSTAESFQYNRVVINSGNQSSYLRSYSSGGNNFYVLDLTPTTGKNTGQFITIDVDTRSGGNQVPITHIIPPSNDSSLGFNVIIETTGESYVSFYDALSNPSLTLSNGDSGTVSGDFAIENNRIFENQNQIDHIPFENTVTGTGGTLYGALVGTTDLLTTFEKSLSKFRLVSTNSSQVQRSSQSYYIGVKEGGVRITRGTSTDGSVFFDPTEYPLSVSNGAHNVDYTSNYDETNSFKWIGGSTRRWQFDGDLKVGGDGGSLAVGSTITPSGTDGRIDASNDIVAFSTSDKRLKKNFIPLIDATNKIKQIGGYEFDWKELTDEQRKTIHGNEGHDVGVIAQEVQKILPEIVNERENGYLAVRYEKLIPLLIESIKELSERIEELENKLSKS